jgi:hypothetical protein
MAPISNGTVCGLVPLHTSSGSRHRSRAMGLALSWKCCCCVARHGKVSPHRVGISRNGHEPNWSSTIGILVYTTRLYVRCENTPLALPRTACHPIAMPSSCAPSSPAMQHPQSPKGWCTGPRKSRHDVSSTSPLRDWWFVVNSPLLFLLLPCGPLFARRGKVQQYRRPPRR